MTYLVLARKWRPQVFGEVVGQPHITRTLQNAIRCNRVAHAYLFTGARGVGKTSVARILAKALNCEKGTSPDPCNECSTCAEITRGNAMDVLEIDGASNRGIDNIRELRETVRYRPVKSRFKIYIIDEVHMLTTEAFNALLKTLEEPPPHVLFVFATTEPHKIPATILSRCQRFDFRRIPTPLILEHLKKIIVDEKAGFPESILYAIALEADGSMRDAQSLLEQLLAFSGDDLPEAEILDLLGVIDRRSVYRMGKAIIDGDAVGCIEIVADLYRRGVDSKRFCRQLGDYFRNLLLISLDQEACDRWLDLPQGEKEFLLELRSKSSVETLHLYLQMLLKGEEEIRRSSQPRFVLEMILLRLCQLPRLRPLDELIDTLNSLTVTSAGTGTDPLPADSFMSAVDEKTVSGRTSLVAEKLVESDDVAGKTSYGQDGKRDSEGSAGGIAADQMLPESITERWSEFVGWLDGKDPILAAKLQASKLVAVGDGRYVLEVLDWFEESLNAPNVLEALKQVMGDYYGIPINASIRVQPAADDEKVRVKARKKSRKDSLTRLVLRHSVVQEALEVLAGELVEIRTIKKE